MLHVNYIGILEDCLYGSSLVAQTVKRLPTMPTMWEIWVQSLGQEDPLEKGLATTPVFLPRESHEQRSLEATDQGVTKSQARLGNRTELISSTTVRLLFSHALMSNSL